MSCCRHLDNDMICHVLYAVSHSLAIVLSESYIHTTTVYIHYNCTYCSVNALLLHIHARFQCHTLANNPLALRCLLVCFRQPNLLAVSPGLRPEWNLEWRVCRLESRTGLYYQGSAHGASQTNTLWAGSIC